MATKPVMTDPPDDFPSRLSPSTYNARMEAYLAWKKINFPEEKVLIDWIDELVDTVSLAKVETEAARDAASLTANATAYAPGTEYSASMAAIGSDGVVYRFVGASPATGDNPVGSSTGNWHSTEIAKYAVYNIGSISSGTVTVDLNHGYVQKLTITGDITIEFSNFVPDYHSPVVLIITDDGDNAITWDSAVKWRYNIEPTIEADSRNRFIFVSENGGTTIDGSFNGGGWS